MATGGRWTRQLMVNRLYIFFKPYVVLYSHNASRNHLASPTAAVVPTSLFSSV